MSKFLTRKSFLLNCFHIIFRWNNKRELGVHDIVWEKQGTMYTTVANTFLYIPPHPAPASGPVHGPAPSPASGPATEFLTETKVRG